MVSTVPLFIIMAMYVTSLPEPKTITPACSLMSFTLQWSRLQLRLLFVSRVGLRSSSREHDTFLASYGTCVFKAFESSGAPCWNSTFFGVATDAGFIRFRIGLRIGVLFGVGTCMRLLSPGVTAQV